MNGATIMNDFLTKLPKDDGFPVLIRLLIRRLWP